MDFQLSLFDTLEEELPHYTKPCNDNEVLLEAQYQFLVFHKKEAWNTLWLKSLVLARKFIHKEMKLKKLRFCKSDVEDKALNAVEYILRRYQTHESYYITKNFPASVYLGVVHALYYMNPNEMLEKMVIDYLNRHKCDVQTAYRIIQKKLMQKLSEKKKKEIKDNGQLELF